MKDIINETIDLLIEMANLSLKRTGLSVDIWSDPQGINGNYQPDESRVKIGKRGQYEIEVSIEEKPRILAQSSNIKKPEMTKMEKAIEYVGRNYDLFFKTL